MALRLPLAMVGANCAVVPIFAVLLYPLIAIVFLVSGLRLAADEVIRIMAANTTSGSNQSYDLGHGNRIFQGLDPDIVLVQEMNVGVSPNKNTPATYRNWVDVNFGSSFSYRVETGKSIPNGIVSRYPILASGVWEDVAMPDREFVWAKIDIPGDKDLWAVSVHLSSSGGSSTRNAQAIALRDLIKSTVPNADFLVVGGDFNTDSRAEACVGTLDHARTPTSGVVVVSGPYPVDRIGSGARDGTNASLEKPYDWVMPDPDLQAHKVPLVIGSQSFPNGLVLDSRVFTPLSAVDPVLSTDSGASGMQHMAVMRAFLIPVNAAPTIVSAAKSASTEAVTDPDSSVYQIVRGTSVGLSVAASDNGGESALKYTWSKIAGAANAVTFSTNGTNAAKNCTATFQAAGNYTLSVTVRDAPGLSVTSAVKVRVVQTPTGLTLAPPTATLAVNATQSFTATVSDQFSQSMASAVSWSATGGGSISSTGLFTATTAGGPHVITASSGGASDTSSVTVTPASAAVSLANLNQTYDGFPKPVIATATPTVQGISLLYNGSSVAPTSAGSYSVSATVMDPNYQGSASGTLVIAPDEWALWKNTWFSSAEQAQGLAIDPADPDADSLLNLAEFALGSNPRQFTPPLPGILDAAGFSITFTRPAGLPGILYFAEATGDFLTWSPVPLEILAPGPVEMIRAREPFGDRPSAPRFLRLRIERE